MDKPIFRCLAALVLAFGLFGLWGDADATTAATMKLTYYDDGLACPGGCDAHVVFRPAHNGTRNAFAPPMASRDTVARKPCVNGQACIICFSEAANSCMETRYRGNGPHQGRFDVTPVFLAEACPKADAPEPVKALCKQLGKAAKPYLAKTNCIAQPERPECAATIAEFRAAYELDRPEYQRCLQIGPKAYNAAQSDPAKHRSASAGCGYSATLKEQNSAGQTWLRLLPGACREGSFVGRWGTDCCTGQPLTDAAFGGGECKAFYRDPPAA